VKPLSASEAVARIEAGTLTSEALVRACLERIAEREPTVRAWAYLDPELALAQAKAADAAKGGVLRGVPVGVKDIIDTHDMPTSYGSPIHAGHRPSADAACVALVREAGAVVLGKTVTTEFALRHPGPTANPRNVAHTPGGSSSGSAAAVADFMVPATFGTQTGGSIIRPASYCGVIGGPRASLFRASICRASRDRMDCPLASR
jgi:amidase